MCMAVQGMQDYMTFKETSIKLHDILGALQFCMGIHQQNIIYQ